MSEIRVACQCDNRKECNVEKMIKKYLGGKPDLPLELITQVTYCKNFKPIPTDYGD